MAKTNAKIVRLGEIREQNRNPFSVFCAIEFDGLRLSITGVEGPKANGNAYGSCGQIVMSYKEFDSRGYREITDINPAPGWSHDLIRQFFTVWGQWHLNDMRSACEHQRALGWTYKTHRGVWETRTRRIPSDLIDEYDSGEREEEYVKWNEYKGHTCPVCGYSIGSAWLTETVPAEVIEFLNSLPHTDIKPYWV